MTGMHRRPPRSRYRSLLVNGRFCEPTAAVNRFKGAYVGNDATGVESYRLLTPFNARDPQLVRVVRPTKPSSVRHHNFLYALPVQAGLKSNYGDGLDVMQHLNVHNEYNVTIISPTFPMDPWYADNPRVPSIRYESMITGGLVPWIRRNFSLSHSEQNWLIGFSKSGLGAQTLILKYPETFHYAASWDFPANMSCYDQYGRSSKRCYGSDLNFQNHYRLTRHFVEMHRAPFLDSNRIWIGGYQTFEKDVLDYAALLTSAGIVHTSDLRSFETHRWDSGWMSSALEALPRTHSWS